MRTEEIYLKDCYVKEFNAEVIDVKEKGIVLNRTAFYPLRGGVDHDTGFIEVNGKRYRVSRVVIDEDGDILHVIDGDFEIEPGNVVKGIIDWERRYRLMKSHTAAHLLEAVIYKETGALIGSSHVGVEKSYLGFTMENYDKELILKAVEVANELIKKGARVKFYFMPREEVMKDKELIKLAARLPPAIKELRIVEIEGIDRQACGGPHVADIKEIGKIVPLKIENKGKGNRRLYYTTE